MGLRMCSPYRPSNSKNYWIRKRVPDALRPIVGKREIKKSLKTSDAKEAARLAPPVLVEIDAELAAARRSLSMGGEDLKSLKSEYFNERVEELLELARRDRWESSALEMMAEQLTDSFTPQGGDLSIEDCEHFLSGECQQNDKSKCHKTCLRKLDVLHEQYEEQRHQNAASWGREAIAPLLQRHKLHPPLPLLERLGWETVRAELDALRAAIADLSGDIGYSRPSYAQEAVTDQATLPELFEGYAASTKLAPRTLDQWRRYTKIANDFFKNRPAGQISRKDIKAFAEALRSGLGGRKSLSVKTINDNYLATLSSVYKWAIDQERLKLDPTQRVRLKASKSESSEKQAFTTEQVVTLLSAAREPQPRRIKPSTANLRRWAPWLCAFTGARIGEVLWLRRDDVRFTQDIAYIDIYADEASGRSVKTRSSTRSTPLHPALIEEGFLDYWRSLPTGETYLFPGDWSDQNSDRTTTPSNHLREWIKETLPDADWKKLSPNHSFRHWLTAQARDVEIDGDLRRVITGHSAQDVHGRYGPADVPMLYRAILKINSPIAPPEEADRSASLTQ